MQKYHDEPKQYKGYLKSALVLHRMTLSFTTPRRFNPAHKETPPMLKVLDTTTETEETPATPTLDDLARKVLGGC